MAADGSVIISADIDAKKAQAELNRLERRMEAINDQIEGKSRKKSYLVEQAEEIKAAYQSAIAAGQDERAETLAKDYDRVNTAIQRTDAQLLDQNIKLGVARDRAGELSAAISGFGTSGEEATNRVSFAMSKLEKRLIGLAKRVFIFSVITKALRSLRTWLASAVASNDEASAAIARLKGALLTLAQPIVQVVIPAFTRLVNVLATVVTAIAQVMASLFGTTVEESAAAAENLYNEQNAIEGVGGAAKKASKQLASFDEINKLSDESGGGGGGGASKTITPDFNIGSMAEEELNRILNLVTMIGAGLAAWKISSALGTGLSGFLQTFAGILLIIDGVKRAYDGLKSAFENGWDTENLKQVVLGLLEIGAGISLLVGGPIPLLIAAIAAALLALVVATGHGEELLDGLRTMFQGFVDFIAGIFTGDIGRAVKGVEEIFDGLKTFLFSIIGGIKDGLLAALDWFDSITNGKFSQSIGFLKRIVIDGFTELKIFVGNIIEALKQIFGGLVQFIGGVFSGDWEMAWKGLANVAIGIVNLIITAVEGLINAIITGINGILNMVNTIIAGDLVNWALQKTVGITWKGIPNIQHVRLPRVPALAEGAVIPPNREFLALLGDQKSGTNIEAPLDTLVAAFRQALGNTSARQPVVLEVNGTEFGRVVLDLYNTESQRVGVKIGGR